jgi:hypothetical protein
MWPLPGTHLGLLVGDGEADPVDDTEPEGDGEGVTDRLVVRDGAADGLGEVDALGEYQGPGEGDAGWLQLLHHDCREKVHPSKQLGAKKPNGRVVRYGGTAPTRLLSSTEKYLTTAAENTIASPPMYANASTACCHPVAAHVKGQKTAMHMHKRLTTTTAAP